VCHAFAACLSHLLAVGVAAKAWGPREASCFREAGNGRHLRTDSRKHGTPGGKTANLCGSGRISLCRTAPVSADESKADRPLSRANAALRSYGLTALAGGASEAAAGRTATAITVATCRFLLSLIAVDLIDHSANGIQPVVPGGAEFDSVNRSRLVAARYAAAKSPDVFIVRPLQRLEHHLALSQFVL
jgi:hypothetical protein